MERELKEGWFVPASIEKTLKNLLMTADPVYVRLVSPTTFEEELVNEVHFLAPYDPREFQEVKLYIHHNLTELYRFAQALAQQE